MGEVLRQEAIDDLADVGRNEPAAFHLDVFAVAQRRDDRGIGRGPADAVLLERLDERRLGVPRRRLREMLLALQLDERKLVAFLERRQYLVTLVLYRVVEAFLVHGHEPGFHKHGTGRAKGDRRFGRLSCSKIDTHGVENRRRHL